MHLAARIATAAHAGQVALTRLKEGEDQHAGGAGDAGVLNLPRAMFAEEAELG